MSTGFFIALLLVVGVERLLEMRISNSHATQAFAHGGVETGRGHYPFMVVLHTGLLVGAAVEVLTLDRPFLPWLGWSALVMVVGAQALRWWCIRTLGTSWNTRVIVVPGAVRVTSGPYRIFDHPNYVAVIVEGAALPLVHSAWITAMVFSVVNLFLLRVRIRCEEAALRSLAPQTVSATA